MKEMKFLESVQKIQVFVRDVQGKFSSSGVPTFAISIFNPEMMGGEQNTVLQ